MWRRGLLRAASMTALVALSSLPSSPAARCRIAPDALSLVPEEEALTLRYCRPGAENRMTQEGLPIGNGRAGALVTGDPSRDTIVLADATL
ncbi:glycoside hydrolase N-terminal domain-containing protein [Streptomyces sp. MS1.AVA.1]|uniref:Glycoside hydrolase N-terminal domain-containing protein n=1 Tax=Streptomyces machairae TaxID=3134109 RepID=A0ABU8UVT5_9ACTN